MAQISSRPTASPADPTPPLVDFTWGRLALGVVALSAATVAAAQTLSLSAATDRALYYPGDTLRLTIAAQNAGGPGTADFYTGLILPDGVTIATIDPSGGVAIGTAAAPAAFRPLARGVGLAGPFSASIDPLFQYAWTGAEPLGSYTVFFAAVRAGGFADNRIDGGDLLAVQFGTLVLRTPATTVPESTPVSTMVTADQGGTVSAQSAAGIRYALTIPPDALIADTTITAAPIASSAGLPVDTLIGAVRFGPDGLKLREPATLTVTMPSAIRPLGIVGFSVNDDGTGFTVLPVTVSGQTASITVTHFSSAGIGISRCGANVTTAVGRDACQRMATDLSDAADIVAAGPDTFPLPVRVLLAAEIATELRTWLASTKRILEDASDPGRTDSAQHHLTMVALRELSAIEAIVELTSGLNTGAVVASELAATQAQAAPAIVARRSVANARCIATDIAERRETSIYLGRILELAGEAEARGLPVDARTRGVTCVRLKVDVAFPATVPAGGAAITASARLEMADGLSILDTRVDQLGHTIDLVDRGQAIIAQPQAANFFGSVTLVSFVQPRSTAGTLAFDVRADVPSIGFSEIRRVSRNLNPVAWTLLSSKQNVNRALSIFQASGLTQDVDSSTSLTASLPDRTITVAGATASSRNVRAALTVSPAGSTALVITATGTAQVLATPSSFVFRSDASAQWNANATFRLDAPMTCSASFTFTGVRDRNEVLRSDLVIVKPDGTQVLVGIGAAQSLPAQICPAGDYQVLFRSGLSSSLNQASLDFRGTVRFDP